MQTPQTHAKHAKAVPRPHQDRPHLQHMQTPQAHAKHAKAVPRPHQDPQHPWNACEHPDCFWDTLWQELWPFLRLMAESRRIVIGQALRIEKAVCYRLVPLTTSGTPCGKSYGLFVFYARISSNRDLASPKYGEGNLLSIRTIDSFWDTLWQELWPFLCYMQESRRTVIWQAWAICSTASGTPCDKSYGLWPVLCFMCESR